MTRLLWMQTDLDYLDAAPGNGVQDDRVPPLVKSVDVCSGIDQDLQSEKETNQPDARRPDPQASMKGVSPGQAPPCQLPPRVPAASHLFCLCNPRLLRRHIAAGGKGKQRLNCRASVDCQRIPKLVWGLQVRPIPGSTGQANLKPRREMDTHGTASHGIKKRFPGFPPHSRRPLSPLFTAGNVVAHVLWFLVSNHVPNQARPFPHPKSEM